MGKNRWTSIFDHSVSDHSVSDQSLFLDWLSKIEKSNIIISQKYLDYKLDLILLEHFSLSYGSGTCSCQKEIRFSYESVELLHA